MKKIIAIPIILVLFFVLIIGLRGKLSGESFDSQKWKMADMNSEDNLSLKWDMMNSLRNNHNLVGMKKSKIIDLLGKPDTTFSNAKTFRYFLGYSHFGIDTGTLIIEFKDDIVINSLVISG
jgi:hypothetical protein